MAIEPLSPQRSGGPCEPLPSINPVEEDPVHYVSPPSQSLQCPICQDVCKDPVITHVCHHSYCSSCIVKSLEHEPYCPLCRRRIRKEDLHPNLALAGLIWELPVYCRYQSQGCQAVLRLDSLVSHVKECGYAPACCPHACFGCSFVGSYKEVQSHLQSECVFQQMQWLLHRTEGRLKQLETIVEAQKSEIESLYRLLEENGISKPSREVDSMPLKDGTMHSIIKSEKSTLGDAHGSPLHRFPAGDIQCRRTIREYSSGVTSVAYSNGTIFSGGHDGSIRLFNAETGTHIKSLQDHRETVWSLVVDSSSRLFSASKDTTIKVWDLKRVRTLSAMSNQSSDTPAEPSSSSVPLLQTLTQHTGKIYSLGIQDSRFLYSGSGDRTIRVWDTGAEGSEIPCVGVLKGHEDGVNAICTMPLPSQTGGSIPSYAVLSASNDKTIKLWDSHREACTATWTCDSEVLDVAYSPSTGLMFASTYDAIIAVYDPRSPTCLRHLMGHKWEVWQLEVVQGMLFSGSFDHCIERWDLRTFQCNQTLVGHQGFVHSMTQGRDCLITGCADRTVKIWS